MRAEQVELHDHAVVGVVDRDHLVALVGKGRARARVVGAHGGFAVVHLTGRDELVARMRERGHRGLEVLAVLGVHVLAHHGLARGSHLVRQRHRASRVDGRKYRVPAAPYVPAGSDFRPCPGHQPVRTVVV